MLNKYKQLCGRVADLMPEWREMTKGQLLDAYVDCLEYDPEKQRKVIKQNKKNEADCYMAAILYSYWGTIDKYYIQSGKSFQLEDYFEWLTHAVMYATEHAVWRDEERAKIKGKIAPTTVMQQCILSTRQQKYQTSNYEKYKGEFTQSSLDALIEDKGERVFDSLAEGFELDDGEFENWVTSIIHKSFIEKDYTKAFMLDLICNGNTFKRVPGKNIKAEYADGINTKHKPKSHRGVATTRYSKAMLMNELAYLDDNYCIKFAHTFGIKPDAVLKANEQLKEKMGVKQPNNQMSEEELEALLIQNDIKIAQFKPQYNEAFKKLKEDVVKRQTYKEQENSMCLAM